MALFLHDTATFLSVSKESADNPLLFWSWFSWSLSRSKYQVCGSEHQIWVVTPFKLSHYPNLRRRALNSFHPRRADHSATAYSTAVGPAFTLVFAFMAFLLCVTAFVSEWEQLAARLFHCRRSRLHSRFRFHRFPPLCDSLHGCSPLVKSRLNSNSDTPIPTNYRFNIPRAGGNSRSRLPSHWSSLSSSFPFLLDSGFLLPHFP